METINNVAAAASKAIWGEQQTATQGTEPIAGQSGKGTVNDPYDQGNQEANPISTTTHPTSNTISSKTTSSETTTLPDRTVDKLNPNTDNTFSSQTHGSDPTGTHDTRIANLLDPRVDSDQVGSQGNTTVGSSTGNTHSHTHGSDPTEPHNSHIGNKADPRVDSDQIGSQGSTTGGGLTGNTHSSHQDTMSSIPTNPPSVATGGVSKPHQETDKTGVIGGHGDPFKTSANVASESQPNTGAPPSDVGLSKQQGAANPQDEPIGRQQSADKDEKDAKDFLKTKDPNDHSGEPMHVHQGAGDGSSIPRTQEERRESKLGQPGGQEHGKEVSEGTGEQWVKTSGLAVDGGDFDATKPGAGREADRLMAQKGIHKTEPGKPSEPLANTSSHGNHGEKEKTPLGEKIKTKLHIGSKDK